MTTTPVLDLLARVLHDAAGLLVELQASRPKPEDLARLLGTSHLTATRLLRNAELFDADQLAAMRTARLSLDTIFTIGKYWRKLSNSQADREGLFADVIARAGTDSLNELEEHLKEVVGALNRQCADKPRSDWARFSRTVDCDGKGYLNIKAPAEALARMNSLIDDEAKAMFHQGHACSIAEAKATIITRRVITYGEREASQSEGEGVNGEDNPLGFKYRPFVVICHPWLLEKRDGKYLTTDGTVVDLRGYADRMLEPFGWVTVPYRNFAGGVEFSDPIEVRRFADDAQRLVLTAAYPTCAHPDCRIAARYCQIHHIQAFAAGGPTEIPNMVPLCMRHNKENDDDPAKPCNGRIEKDPVTSRIGRRRWPNEPLRFTKAPPTRYGAFEQSRAFFDRVDEYSGVASPNSPPTIATVE